MLRTVGDVGTDIKAVTASLRQSLAGDEGQRRLDEIVAGIADPHLKQLLYRVFSDPEVDRLIELQKLNNRMVGQMGILLTRMAYMILILWIITLVAMVLIGAFWGIP